MIYPIVSANIIPNSIPNGNSSNLSKSYIKTKIVINNTTMEYGNILFVEN